MHHLFARRVVPYTNCNTWGAKPVTVVFCVALYEKFTLGRILTIVGGMEVSVGTLTLNPLTAGR